MSSYECCIFPCIKPVKCKKAKSVKTPQKWTISVATKNMYKNTKTMQFQMHGPKTK